MTKDLFLDESDYKKYKIIEGYLEQINELKDDHLVFDKDYNKINGQFVFDTHGVPGCGIKTKAKYDHLFGRFVRTDDKDLIAIDALPKNIKSYFDSLQFIPVKSIKNLK